MRFNIKKFVIIVASIMAFSFIIAGIVFYFTGGIKTIPVAASDVKTSKTFKQEDVESIVINTIDTDIDIIPAVIKRVDIDFYGNVRTNLSRGAPSLKTHLDKGILTVEVTYPRIINVGLINLSQLNLDIYIPPDFRGDIMVTTASGDLEVKNLSPSTLDFQSTSGEMNADSIDCKEFKIKSTSGDILIENSSGRIDVDTISGGLKACLGNFDNDIKIKTISGQVILILPKESQFTFDINTISGDILNEFGAKLDYSDSGNISGTVKKGDFDISINTTSGDIKIKKGGKSNE